MIKIVKCFFIISVASISATAARCEIGNERFISLTSIKKDTLQPESIKNVVKITRSWGLPDILRDISGVDYLDSVRMVCIQNEIGSIFIFNTSTGAVESQIPFGPPGDYEAVAVVKDDVYVACADGRLYEVSNYKTEKPVVKEYGTHLTAEQNASGLCYDPKNKRLLVSIKGSDDGSQFYKGIYAFDLVTKKMPVKPVIRIDLQDSVFAKAQQKKLQMVIQPSEITVRPSNGDIYITDGSRQQLLIMNQSGVIKSLLPLSKFDISQPEGITFSPDGLCYISNQGNKQQPGQLLLVELNELP